jgi:hypothetical protein
MSDLFLFVTLFFPRIGLFFAYFINHNIPFNPVPFFADVILAIFFPRILILIYIAFTDGFGVWFWVHLIFALFAYSKGSSEYNKRTN